NACLSCLFSIPLIVTVPVVALESPMTVRMKVLFPAPFPPHKARIRPLSSCKERGWRMVLLSIVFSRSQTSKMMLSIVIPSFPNKCSTQNRKNNPNHYRYHEYRHTIWAVYPADPLGVLRSKCRPSAHFHHRKNSHEFCWIEKRTYFKNGVNPRIG